MLKMDLCRLWLLLFSFIISVGASASGSNSFEQQHVIFNLSNQLGQIASEKRVATGNAMDDCWRGDEGWSNNRMQLAKCGMGYGGKSLGGYSKAANYYLVTDSGDDPKNPQPGTLRYGVIQAEALWINFKHNMLITLGHELLINSHKTIDGRGVEVSIAFGACLTLYHVSHVIIHGLRIHDCKPTNGGWIRSKVDHISHRGRADGDAIRVFESHDIWIDHNTFFNCHDGLVDVLHGSTNVTISNNHFHDHNKVMLLGHADQFHADIEMKVTVAYNRFGPNCVQRMPRCRSGYFHVVNNEYDAWGMYAIGGSSNPTIISEANLYAASVDHPKAKQVTKRIEEGGNYVSIDDVFVNSAYFVQSGNAEPPLYTSTQSFTVGPATSVPLLTVDAGAWNQN